MRFQRADLPGILLATLGPAALTVLCFAAYGLWHHEGTPLLPVIASVLAVGGGMVAAFTRFLRHWRPVAALLVLLLLDVGVVIGMQQAGYDGTAAATALKVLGVLLFLALNAVALLDMLNEGLSPVVERRDQRKAARASDGPA